MSQVDSKEIYILPIASDEQKACISDILSGCNLRINAVAGSGKTTTILHISSEILKSESFDPKPNILLLTYNARLKEECREKNKNLNLNSILEVHSFHSFCHKYYLDCLDDFSIEKLLQNPNQFPPRPWNKNRKETKPYQLLFLDELQDMNETYYNLVLKIIDDYFCLKTLQIACIGDPKQSIFQFNGATTKFLLNSADFFTIQDACDRKWVNRTLSISYRMTAKITNFINDLVLQTPRFIQPGNLQPKSTVFYRICDPFKPQVASEIVKLLGTKNYIPDDIFVLTPSLKGDKSPARKTENMLVSWGIPCYVPSDEQSKIDADLTVGKVSFATFHQVKGLERKVVFLFGIDASYFNFFAKDEPKDQCPNAIYVAMTRAKEILVIIQSEKEKPCAFIDTNPETLEKYVTLDEKKKKTSKPKKLIRVTPKETPAPKTQTWSVTQLTRHRPVKLLIEAKNLLTIENMTPDLKDKTQYSDIQFKIPTIKNQFEDVSSIYGILVPAWFTYQKTNRCSVLETVMQDKKIGTTLVDEFNKLKKRSDKIKKMMQICTLYLNLMDGYAHKMVQITDYGFVNIDFINHCVRNLENKIQDKQCLEEHSVHLQNFIVGQEEKTQKRWMILGRIDMIEIDTDYIWEIKCTNRLEVEHILQTALYLILSEKSKYGYLYNCVTNECLRITRPEKNVCDMFISKFTNQSI